MSAFSIFEMVTRLTPDNPAYLGCVNPFFYEFDERSEQAGNRIFFSHRLLKAWIILRILINIVIYFAHFSRPPLLFFAKQTLRIIYPSSNCSL